MPGRSRSVLEMLGMLAAASAPVAQTLVDSLLVGMVPAGFPVGFDLLTQVDRQFIAYYDSGHNMVVASRRLDSLGFLRKVLPSKVGWDPHNRVVLESDDQGHLHVSGNMHANPLVYFRTATAGDVNSLVRVPNMVSAAREARVTYPRFFKMPAGELYFNYRLGSSGDGVWHINKYDSRPSVRAWSALYGGTALFGNAGSVNAYFSGPSPGPDGRHHISFLWRDTPDAATCHDIGYIRTRGANLDAWETITGRPLTLPVTLADVSASVDPVQAGKGLINSSMSLGFDSRGRAVISYHKYDPAGVSQVFNSRWSEAAGKWDVVQASDWKDYTWAFGGSGSIPREIHIGSVEAREGALKQSWEHAEFGKGTWTLDENTLRPFVPAPAPSPGQAAEFREEATRMDAVREATVPRPAIQALEEQFRWGRGQGRDPGIRFALRWRTLPPNRGLVPDPIPPDSRLMLLIYQVDPVSAAKAAESPRRRLLRGAMSVGNRVGFAETAAGSGTGRIHDGRGRAMPTPLGISP